MDHPSFITKRWASKQRYYAWVNAQSRLERVKHDADFLRDPQHHVALFSDHGVVHARDVARQILQVIDVINAVLVPARDSNRLEFMRGYGVMVAYLHDIGMMDFSPSGRAMHPEFATQAVFELAFDDIANTVWDENWGNVAWRLSRLRARVQDLNELRTRFEAAKAHNEPT